MIRKSSNGYTVYARTGRPMGTYRTREQAEVRLGQLEAFKAQRAPQMSPTVRPKRGGYYVRAKSGRNMGWYPTKAEALRRKGQLEANGAKFFKETRGYTRQASPNGQMGTQRGTARLECGVDNGISGDGRLVLAMREVRDVVPGADRSREIIPAIETNGNPIGIMVDPTWSLGESAVDVAGAADLLGTTPQVIQEAVLAAWPAAAEWDWDQP